MAYLICPGDGNRLTGGYIYNNRISAILPGLVHWEYLNPPSIEDTKFLNRYIASKHVLIFDSLYLNYPEEAVTLIESTKAKHIGIIIHYLPSENPLLPAAQSEAAKKKEAVLLDRAQFFIATSSYTGNLINNRIPGKDVIQAAPGSARELHSKEQHYPPLKQGIRKIKNLFRYFRRPLLLSAGTLQPSKGFMFLLAVMEQLDHLKWQWEIAGEINRDSRFSKQFHFYLHQSGIKSRVRMKGGLKPEAYRRLLKKADLFLMPSYTESFGMAAAEAAASGVPVIASNTGGLPEAIIDGRGGVLLPAGNVEAWKNCLTELLQNRSKIREIKSEVEQIPPEAFPSWRQSAESIARVIRKYET